MPVYVLSGSGNGYLTEREREKKMNTIELPQLYESEKTPDGRPESRRKALSPNPELVLSPFSLSLA